MERLNTLLKRSWFLPLPLGGVWGGCEAWHAKALSPTLSQREREKDFKLILMNSGEKASVESAWQQFFDRTFLGFALQIGEYDRRVLAKFPNNLPAGAAWRC